MTTEAADTIRSDDSDITDLDAPEQELPSAEEMRQARRRGLIEGVIQRNGLDTYGDDEEVIALVLAGSDDEPDRARALVAALTSDSDRIEAVSSDLVAELRAFEADLRALASNDASDLSEDARRALAAAALETADLLDDEIPAETCEGCGAPATRRSSDEIPLCQACFDAIPATPPQADESHELPVHRVTCMVKGCKAGATYRPTASGAGFMVLERFGMDLEASLGAGPNGRPVCPVDGHGEMTLADEQLSAADAIAQVADRVEREKKPPRLPFPAPPFNYEAVFLEIVGKRHKVADLERDYERKKESASKAKKALDEGNEQLGQMIDDYEDRAQERQYEIERREAQAAAGHPEGATLVRCVWEQQHPDDLCPLCAKSSVADRQRLVKTLGAEVLPRDANGHAEQVVTYREKLDIQSTADAIDGGAIFGVTTETIVGWSQDTRAVVRQWVVDGAKSAELPRHLVGTPHVAAETTPDAKVQTCAVCGGVIKQLDTIAEAYPTGALVRLDCAGAEPDGHRYPDTSKPKKARRAKRDEPATPPAAPAARTRGVTKPAASERQPKAAPTKASTKKSAGKKTGKGRR